MNTQVESTQRIPVGRPTESFHRPTEIEAALEHLAERPEALPVAGGTDVMVAVNYRHLRPTSMLDLTAVRELAECSETDGSIRIGAAVTYTRIIAELGTALPGLAAAARTVGSPQIRNRGTLGGNLGTASPAGDAHPPLLAAGAEVEIASTAGRRTVPIADFYTGPKRNALAPGELVTAVIVPKARGPQQFLKVGNRGAMVIAVCSFALSLDVERRRVGAGIGSAGPTPLRAAEAESIELPWDRPGRLDDETVERFGSLVAAAARPIDDVRGTAAYRRHALAVCARRALLRAWKEWTCN